MSEKFIYHNIIFDLKKDNVEIVINKDFLNNNFIAINHKEQYDPNSIIGEVTQIDCEEIIKGDIKIYEHSMERYSQDVIESLTPSICGKILEKDGDKITKFEILSVGLCSSKNVDENVKSIKEQLNEQQKV